MTPRTHGVEDSAQISGRQLSGRPNKNYEIAFDIDDTITLHPEFFSLSSKALVDAGHEVLIVTFRTDRLEAHRFLQSMQIEYTHLITLTQDEQLHRDLDPWKGEICQRYRVDVFFEDRPEVIEHVRPPTICFMPVDQTPSGPLEIGW